MNTIDKNKPPLGKTLMQDTIKNNPHIHIVNNSNDFTQAIKDGWTPCSPINPRIHEYLGINDAHQ